MFRDGFALIVLVMLLAWHYHDPLPDPESPGLNIDGITLGMDRREAEAALGIHLKPVGAGAWNHRMGTQVLFDEQERVRAIRGGHLGLGDWRLLKIHDNFAKMVTRLGPYQSISCESAGAATAARVRFWFRYPDRCNTPRHNLQVITSAATSRGRPSGEGDPQHSQIEEFYLEQNPE